MFADATWNGKKLSMVGVAQLTEESASLVSFDPWSLDYIYYPVSGIMWIWYKVFGLVLGPTSFFTWALTVMFLVFTLRAILYKPFVKQIRTTRVMQEMQPQIKALQKKYGKDRQRMALEMQKLQREHGVNPILGCLPMLAQIPVFLGLYHVLMSFNRTQTGFGRLGLSPEVNRQYGNYFFSAGDVGNFLDAHLFGAPIGAAITRIPPYPFGFPYPTGVEAFKEYNQLTVVAIGVPLMLLAGVATHMNSRASIARQSPEAAANPQTAIMNRLALYLFPLGVMVGGPVLPLAIILYWFSNNIWTFGQQHYVFGKIEKEEAEKKAEAVARRTANAPAPGAKPSRSPKKQAAPNDSEPASTEITTSEASENGKPAAVQKAKRATSGANTGGSVSRTPRPGARPKKRKR
ncbi:MAG: YidC/Oxa1 family rane protein insertase [Mycobacterium sp.]|nr:YidC/Oxa1 family rane protein insertase [Mycobacterium sp.]